MSMSAFKHLSSSIMARFSRRSASRSEDSVNACVIHPTREIKGEKQYRLLQLLSKSKYQDKCQTGTLEAVSQRCTYIYLRTVGTTDLLPLRRCHPIHRRRTQGQRMIRCSIVVVDSVPSIVGNVRIIVYSSQIRDTPTWSIMSFLASSLRFSLSLAWRDSSFKRTLFSSSSRSFC